LKNVNINMETYNEKGFGDLYLSLISFIGRYAEENFDPLEVFQNEVSNYALAIIEMKKSLKAILDYLITVDEVYLPSLNRNVKLKSLTFEEQIELEKRCKEYILINLNNIMAYNEENTHKQNL